MALQTLASQQGEVPAILPKLALQQPSQEYGQGTDSDIAHQVIWADQEVEGMGDY